MKTIIAAAVTLVVLNLGPVVQADVLNMSPGLTSLETVIVADAGNVADSSTGNSFGRVDYDFYMGKYEVTVAQYVEFLNAKAQSDPYGLYNPNMYYTGLGAIGCGIERAGSSGSYVYTVQSPGYGDMSNRSVNYVSFWDACRFANWLHNGQGDGDTETGAYNLNGYNGTDGKTIFRIIGARWFVSSEDEWHKSAYYSGGGLNGSYHHYPTQTSTDPSNKVVDPDPGNNANFYLNGYTVGSPYYRTPVGEFENSNSAYGTFDQGGNVWEWTDSIKRPGYAFRTQRGGSWGHSGWYITRAARGLADRPPTFEDEYSGFRVAFQPGYIEGTITLQDFLGDLTLSPVRIELKDAGGTVVQSMDTILSANPGAYTLSVQSGSYTVSFQSGKFLTRVKSVQVNTGTVTSCDISLMNGDADGSDEVTTTDLSIILKNLD